MSYINNESVTITATLTKKGRELLAKNGGLTITSFALADDEIDYSLYQPNHPSGSEYYDIAIKNTPIFEAFSDETQTMKHKLVTLPSGFTTIPVISIGVRSIDIDSNYSGQISINPITTPTYNLSMGYTVILSDKSAGTVVVTQALPTTYTSASIPSYIGDISSTSAQTVVGMTFAFIPNSSLSHDVITNLTIVGNESGGSITIPVTVNVA